MPPSGSSVRVDRVVAVVAALRDGREQLGSGYLVTGRLVLTAEHCTRDKATGESAVRLQVVRASDSGMAKVDGIVSDHGLDVAVLQLADDAPWDTDLPPLSFARVDQSHGGVLDDCTGIGFPLFQRDPARRTRHTSEFHGRIYQTDEWESERLLMREPLIRPGPVTGLKGDSLSELDEEGPSPWGGLSGALMFYRGSAIGVIVEHRPRQGDNSLLAIGFKKIAAASAKIRQCLGLAEPDNLPYVSEQVAVRLEPAGWPLAEVTDPFALEVHRPVQLEAPQAGLPELPRYVSREHDTELGAVVQAVAQGSSKIAVLVGGSSTGKTRACWEVLRLLRDQEPGWRLWHPIDPSRADAALRELPAIGPRTVVWLNEAQFYLDVPGGLGERVAAGLRELLRDRARAPVLVLATLWPRFWDVLTARPEGGADPHGQARELLVGRDITVPAAFTPVQLQWLSQAGDARLVQAAAGAEDGQVIQFLAGVPELLARYRNAPPAAAALIHAAMDARRLGMRLALPRSFLEGAAPGYMTGLDWDQLPENWLVQALAYTVAPCRGVRGPLTRIRPPNPGPDHAGGAAGTGQDGTSLYRLAEYLDQYGRRQRRALFPPPSFWTAALCAQPADLTTFAAAASARGLDRDAARLLKTAAARGDPRAAADLIDILHDLHPGDPRPAQWATADIALDLDDPASVASLLDSLMKADAQDQVTSLLARNPVAHVSVDDPDAVISLLAKLGEAGAQDQVTVLAERAAKYVTLDDPAGVADLLDSLQPAGAQDQVTTLLARDPAAHVTLDVPGRVAMLLDSLREAGAQDQVTSLLARDPAAHVELGNPAGVDSLLDSLREAGARDQVARLLARDQAERAAKHAAATDPAGVASLDSPREAREQEQVTALAERARRTLDDPSRLARLLDSLLEAGEQDLVTTLLAADPAAHLTLGGPRRATSLLDSLRETGDQDQVTALVERAAHTTRGSIWGFFRPVGIRRLLDSLRKGRRAGPGYRLGQ